jgi:hypothetical protein
MNMPIPFRAHHARDAARADWIDERRREARAVVADVVHHSDALIQLACRFLVQHGQCEQEREDARLLLTAVDGWQLGQARHHLSSEVAS